MAQRKTMGPAIAVATNVKISRSAQAQAEYVGVKPEFGFVVAVPTHGVPAVAVQVSQDGVAADPEFPFKAVAEGLELGGPPAAVQRSLGVGVVDAGVSFKKGEPRFGDFAAKHANAPLGPVASGFKVGEQSVGLGWAQPAAQVGERTYDHAEAIQSRVSPNGLKARPQPRALSLR